MSKKWPNSVDSELLELPDPQDAFRQNDLLNLMQYLSHEHREVLVLCGLLGYDYETTAEIIHVPLGTVRSRLARAREAMSTLLSDIQRASETGA